jgi:short-subunit dehydrogenase
MEAREHGIQVTTVCPANIETPHHRNLTNLGYDQEKIASMDNNRMSAADCARITLRGVARRKKLVVMQASLWLPWFLYRLLPRLTMAALAGPVYTVLKKNRLPRRPALSGTRPRG